MKKRRLLNMLSISALALNSDAQIKDRYKTEGFNTNFKTKPKYKLNGRHHGQKTK